MSDASRPVRYRELEVSGTPRELGRQVGEGAREEIREFCSIALDRVNKTVAVSETRAREIAAACVPYAESYRPDLVDELRGTAEAAGVSLEDLMLLQIRNQLQPEADAGCTSLSIAAEATDDVQPIVAQNWDNDPELDSLTLVLTRRPAGRPSFVSVTQAGLIAYMGFNEQGVGACVNTLPAPSRPVGVPHYFTLREILEGGSLEDAVRAVSRAERAIPANIMLCTPDGPADLEVTIEQVHVIRDDNRGYLCHTNHCVHPELVQINSDFPELIESHPRQDRMEAILEQAARPFTPTTVQSALSDHEGHPCSICRHSNHHPVTGFWVTVFSMVMEPMSGRMWVARGRPCEVSFEQYEL